MARKKNKDPEAAMSAFLGGLEARLDLQRARAEEVHGDAIVPVDLAGLWLPHLSLRYVFRRRVLPFCRSYGVFGPPGSGKSALVYYFYKLFVDAGGRYLHLETEDKDQQDLRESVTGYPGHINDSKWRHRAPTINAYQMLYYGYLEWMRLECEKADVGRTVPFIVGIDSLTAKLAEHTENAFVKAGGQVTQRFGEAAGSLANWFRMATNSLHGWPFVLFGVNHDKEKTDRYGNPQHHAPGGSHPLYMATTRILCERVKVLNRVASGEEGILVRLKSDKNSAAPTGQFVEVEFKWNAAGGQRQVSWWDWDKATTVLVHALIENSEADLAKALKAATGLVKVNNGAWTSKVLGITEPVSPSEMGKALEASPVIEELDKLLEVREGVVFKPGDDMSNHVQRTVADG